MPQIERRLLLVPLTEWELNERRDRAAKLDGDRAKLEVEKKKVVDEFKSKETALEYEMRVALREIRDKAAEREIECEWEKNYDKGTAELIRIDTYEVVETRPLFEHERQENLLDRVADKAAEKIVEQMGGTKKSRKKGATVHVLDGGKADAAAERKADREEMAGMPAKAEPKEPDLTVGDAVTQAARDAVMGKLPEDMDPASLDPEKVNAQVAAAVATVRRDGDSETRTYMTGPDGVTEPVNQAAKDYEAAKLQANEARLSVDGTSIEPPPAVRDEDLWTENDVRPEYHDPVAVPQNRAPELETVEVETPPVTIDYAGPKEERAPALLKAPKRERKVQVLDGDGNPINVDDGPGAA